MFKKITTISLLALFGLTDSYGLVTYNNLQQENFSINYDSVNIQNTKNQSVNVQGNDHNLEFTNLETTLCKVDGTINGAAGKIKEMISGGDIHLTQNSTVQKILTQGILHLDDSNVSEAEIGGNVHLVHSIADTLNVSGNALIETSSEVKNLQTNSAKIIIGDSKIQNILMNYINPNDKATVELKGKSEIGSIEFASGNGVVLIYSPDTPVPTIIGGNVITKY